MIISSVQIMENQPGKDVFCLHLWSTRSRFVSIFGYKHTKGAFLAESPHAGQPFALGVALFCGFITALSLYSHIIERLDERMKQDSQYCIRHLLRWSAHRYALVSSSYHLFPLLYYHLWKNTPHLISYFLPSFIFNLMHRHSSLRAFLGTWLCVVKVAASLNLAIL